MIRSILKKAIRPNALFARLGSSSTTPAASSDSKVVLQETIPGFREPGVVATDYEIASGLERYELLKTLRGEDPWEDLHPIKITAKGTVKNPIIVRVIDLRALGIDDERYIGCTGFPADSHTTTYLTVRQHSHNHVDRCHICGNVFKYIKEEPHHDEHH